MAAITMVAMTTVPVLAQSALTRVVPVSFTGSLSTDVASTILIQQADGSLVPFTGTVPAYPYAPGTMVTVSFQLEVPTAAYYASSFYTGPQSADGTYAIQLTNNPINMGEARQIGNTAVSGPINADPLPTVFSGLGLTINTQADSYNLQFGSGGFAMSGFNTPSYLYDASTGSLTPTVRDCFVPFCDTGGLTISGNGSDLAIGWASGTGSIANWSIPQGTIPVGNLVGTVAGWFSGLSLSGSWNMPTGGGITSVPEPGMLGLFGGAALIVMARRRKRQAASG